LEAVDHLMEEYSRIFRYIDEHKPRLLEVAKNLVKIPSENPPGNTKEVAQATASFFSELGLHTELIEARSGKVNVVARWEVGGSQMILFNCHLDTVPTMDVKAWNVDPFSGEVKADWLYGRGAADDKGALASLLISLKALKELGMRPSCDLIVHAVCDEETGGEQGTSYLINKGHAEADFGFVLEASVKKHRIFVRNAMKGVMKLKVKAKGRAAHASNPRRGVNATLKLAKVLLALDRIRLRHKPSKYLTAPTVAVGTIIRGGLKRNVIPDSCYAVCDVRYLPGMSEVTVRQDIEKLIHGLKRKDPGLDVSLEVGLGKHKPAQLGEKEDVVSMAKEAIRKVVGYEPKLHGGYGATDAAQLIHDARIPTLIGLGPGDIELSNIHGPNERVSVRAMLEFSKVYALLAVSSLYI